MKKNYPPATANASWLILRGPERFEVFVSVCMIVSKRCQPLLTAKVAFAGGSWETSQAHNVCWFDSEFAFSFVERD